MTHDEAIKIALEGWLNTPLSADEIAFCRSDGKVTTQVSVAFYAGYKAALDSLAIPVMTRDKALTKIYNIADEIACLGHGREYGDSEGNRLAIDIIQFIDSLNVIAPKAVEPSEDISKLVLLLWKSKWRASKEHWISEAAALITADRERIRRECKAAGEIAVTQIKGRHEAGMGGKWHSVDYVDGLHDAMHGYSAAIMGEAKK